MCESECVGLFAKVFHNLVKTPPMYVCIHWIGSRLHSSNKICTFALLPAPVTNLMKAN